MCLLGWPLGLSYDKNLGLRPRFSSAWVPRAIRLSTLRPVANDLLNDALRLDNELSAVSLGQIKSNHCVRSLIAGRPFGPVLGFYSCWCLGGCGVGFLIFGCWCVFGGGWVWCGLFGCWVGWVVVVCCLWLFSLVVFLCWGWGVVDCI